jgi:hypothetical protein
MAPPSHMTEGGILDIENALSDAVNHAMQRPLEDPLATITEQLLKAQQHRSWAPESVTSTTTPGSPPQATVLVTMDPGQDLDDEMLIVLLSALRRRGNVRCVGVVATLAPATMRAQLARGTLDELGMRDVPVGAGSDGGASGSTDFEGLAYLRPPRSAHLSATHICTLYLHLVTSPLLCTSILHLYPAPPQMRAGR